ncbi:MAG: FmdE family protein [Oscillospiraceae bacterium]|nr:FmdE family protein [Oscillospiraceae bacterium]
MTEQFQSDLKKATLFHGHACTGIILGVRMARAGLSYLGINDPEENRDFIVYLEIDRCLADAIQSVTGLSFGKRRLKAMGYGKMAASFIDMNTGKGVRIVMNAKQEAPEKTDQVQFWDQFPDEQLFQMEPVMVDLKPEDLPGPPVRTAVCELCHEKIMDGKDIVKDGQILCKACAEGAYYRKI